MLLSFLKVDPETELRNRKRKASKEKLNNRALKVIARNRVQQYEDSRRIKEIVPEVLDECVDDVTKLAERRVIIFGGYACEASEAPGIARSTLLGWVSRNVKSNIVYKCFDIVANLIWGEIKKCYSEEIRDRFGFIEDDSRIRRRFKNYEEIIL